MPYVDAIKWLREHDVKKEDGTQYDFGDVSDTPLSKYLLELIPDSFF